MMIYPLKVNVFHSYVDLQESKVNIRLRWQILARGSTRDKAWVRTENSQQNQTRQGAVIESLGILLLRTRNETHPTPGNFTLSSQ